MAEIKSTLDRIDSGLDTVEENICEFEDREMKSIQNETQREKNCKNNLTNTASLSCRTNIHSLIYKYH